MGTFGEMKSDHIDNSRLYDAVNEAGVLEDAEVQHLSTCEECLELIRVLVRQSLAKRAGAS
jgi:hypothetical protein